MSDKFIELGDTLININHIVFAKRLKCIVEMEESDGETCSETCWKIHIDMKCCCSDSVYFDTEIEAINAYNKLKKELQI